MRWPKGGCGSLVWCLKRRLPSSFGARSSFANNRESRLSIEGEDDARPLLLIPDNSDKGGQEICRKLRGATRTVLASLTEALRLLRYPGCRLYSQLQIQNFTTLKGSPITVSISPWDSAGEQEPHHDSICFMIPTTDVTETTGPTEIAVRHRA